MKFATKSAAIPNLSTSCLVLAVHEKGNLPSLTAEADKLCKGALSKIIRNGDISGKTGSTLLLQGQEGLRAKRILLVGCGKKSDITLKRVHAILDPLSKALEKYHLEDALLALDLDYKDTDSESVGKLIGRFFTAAGYRYSETKSKQVEASSLKKVDVYGADRKQQSALKKGLAVGEAIGKGMNVARELGNLPGNICTPTYLGEQAMALGKRHKNLKVKVLSEAQMKRLGMNALLSVGNGSEQPSTFIVMEYTGTTETTKPNVIVGKGITFDTGGISLKPGNAMDEMKFDMCGAASVLGTMTSLCELAPKTNVVGIIASAENMPSGRATKPGDIITSMSGQTIEVLNTDAEGRLVLCDALTYAERFKPKSVIDIATLTGAILVALGGNVSGLMSNDDDLADTLYSLGQANLDTCWRLPIWDDYQKQLDSNFADVANIGGPKAGAITAGCFLARFTKKYKWAHLDIAGTAWLQGAQKGATGRPVPLLVDYLLGA